MRTLRVALAAALVLGAAVALPSTASADTTSPTYYLALGDSLSQGYEPVVSGGQIVSAGDTDRGYVDDLYTKLQAANPSLQLVKLGCSGETTGSMISGGVCTDGRYTTGSQLGDVEAFLAAHKGQVKYLTIDIGANDVDSCAPGGSIDFACVVQGLGTIAKNLFTILSGLHKAGLSGVTKVAMNYYDPFLADYLTGTQGQVVADASVALLEVLNATEELEYSLYGFKIADVASAFKSTSFGNKSDVPPYGTLPANVANICTLTYMCEVQNIHANDTGYQVIADTFAAKLHV